MDGKFITVARVLKPQGRHGELLVELHSDAPERFQAGARLLALESGGEHRRLEIEDRWPHKGQLVLKFTGIDSISAAETLAGYELQVPKQERARLERGWTYISDLAGCELYDRDRLVGRVTDVRFDSGEAPLLVVKADDKEFEIPFAEAFLTAMDVAGRQIRMSLPEGLLEVNAPLTAEEKQDQNRRPRFRRKGEL